MRPSSMVSALEHKLHTTVYSFAPMRDEFDEPNQQRLATLTKCAAFVVSLYSMLYFAFCLLRVAWCYNSHLPIDSVAFYGHNPLSIHYDFYYVSMGAMAAQVGVQGMAIAFSFLFLTGAIKRQQSYIVLWILSAFVLIALETAIILYSNALRTHAHVNWDHWARAELAMYAGKLLTNLPSLTLATLYYRAIDAHQQRFADETRYLI